MRLFLTALVLLASACPSSNSKSDQTEPTTTVEPTSTKEVRTESPTKFAVFAGGCFWCTESDFEKIDGVVDAVSGFSGGPEENPSYKAVASGKTGHTEVVKVLYDPNKVTYSELVEAFWRMIDPTDATGSFVDRGPQYRPEIFYINDVQKTEATASKEKLVASKKFEKPIIVPITKFEKFWPAEDYHQDFYKKSSMRYKSYRRNSGRDQFIERHWK